MCEIDCDGEPVVAVGHMPFLTPGETVNLTGVWTEHSEYGKQLKVESIERVLPQSVEAIYAYLASRVLSGVGPVTARRIVDLFGENSLDIIRCEPERLTEVRGINAEKAAAISEAFILRQDTAETVMFFQQFGISPAYAMKIYKKYGTEATEKVKENPYILCETVQGIGFKICDKIAVNVGLPFDSKNRIKSGLRHSLVEAAAGGHTCYPVGALVEYASKLLGCDAERVNDCLSEMILSGGFIRSGEYVYLPRLYNAELSVANRLRSLSYSETQKDEHTEEYLRQFSEESGFELSSEQRNAVITASEKKAMVITGGPGTGKTTIMRAVLRVMTRRGLEVALCAPTGKAAKRLEEACGFEAKTIHRLLEAGASIDDEDKSFSRNEANPLGADCIIVDEMSMVDIQLMDALLKAMKRGAGIIMAGDADQLPSVGAGNVLRDILASKIVPAVRLNTVFRQAGESMIVVNAHKINNGEMPLLTNNSKDFFFLNRPDHHTSAQVILDLISERLPKAYGYDRIADIQVLSPSKKGVCGVNELNALLRERLNPPSKKKHEQKRGTVVFREGDKVIQIKNSYDTEWKNPKDKTQGFGIFNGDIGIIKKISSDDKVVGVEFDDGKLVDYDFASLDNLEPAYALTVHKSQGCEFKAVIIPVCRFAPMLMTRNLLYTAITRAKELVVLVGDVGCIEYMVSNNRRAKRYTGLREKLEVGKDEE